MKDTISDSQINNYKVETKTRESDEEILYWFILLFNDLWLLACMSRSRLRYGASSIKPLSHSHMFYYNCRQIPLGWKLPLFVRVVLQFYHETVLLWKIVSYNYKCDIFVQQCTIFMRTKQVVVISRGFLLWHVLLMLKICHEYVLCNGLRLLENGTVAPIVLKQPPCLAIREHSLRNNTSMIKHK